MSRIGGFGSYLGRVQPLCRVGRDQRRPDRQVAGQGTGGGRSRKGKRKVKERHGPEAALPEPRDGQPVVRCRHRGPEAQ